MTNAVESWGPFVILHPDPLEAFGDARSIPVPVSPPVRRERKVAESKLEPIRESRSIELRSVHCDHQDQHPEVDEDIIDLYASGWKTEPVRSDTPITSSPHTPSGVSAFDDDSDTDTLRASTKGWKKAVRACKGRLKQMRSREDLLGLSRKTSQSSLPLVRISSVAKLERHYGYTSPELQRIGIDAGDATKTDVRQNRRDGLKVKSRSC